MRQSWFLWTTSTAAFFLTAIAIVVSGAAQEPAQGRQTARRSVSNINQLSIRNSNARGQSVQGQNFQAQYVERQSIQSQSGQGQSIQGQTVQGQTVQNSSFESAAARPFSKAVTDYQPIEKVYLADPSNYGERFSVDANGNMLDNQYIVVLHETVGSASSALNLFQTHHPNDNDQVSYHTLIGADGTIYYVVPPEQRAFGAGDSVFQSAVGEEAVFTNPNFPSSVNNFAYHISLETPPDGQNNNRASHSGYTAAQYQSLAWLLARTTIPNDRITTHKAVDRSGSRSDPRSFEPQRLIELLEQYPNRAGL